MAFILQIILFITGVCYVCASEMAMFGYIVSDTSDDNQITKELVKLMLMFPVALIIGPYFIYKALKGGR